MGFSFNASFQERGRLNDEGTPNCFRRWEKVDRLNKLSATTWIPQAALVRKGIGLMLEKQEIKLKRKRKKREER